MSLLLLLRQTATPIALDAVLTGAATVSADLSVYRDVKFKGSTYIAAGAADTTTALLTVPTGKSADFEASRISDDTNPLPSITLTADHYTEVEFCLEVDASTPNGTVIELRISNAGAALDGYDQTIQITVGAGSSIDLEASLTGTGTVAGSLTTQKPLVAAANTVGSVAGALSTSIRCAAAMAASAVVSAVLSTSILMASALPATATVAAPLTTQKPLVAALSGTGSVAAALTTAIPLVSAASATATVTAPLSTTIQCATSITGAATVTADLTVTAGTTYTCTPSGGMSYGGAAAFTRIFKCKTSGLPARLMPPGFTTGDVYCPADYDGDGKLDQAYWRPAVDVCRMHIWPSNGGSYYTIDAGVIGAIPVPGNYLGLSHAQVAFWTPVDGNWYVRRDDNTYYVKQWGQSGDVPVPADFNGDGLLDWAIWRCPGGNWYVWPSNDDGSGVYVLQWGEAIYGDVPVPADWDRDGKADIAVWRRQDTNWYVMNSGNTPPSSFTTFGNSSDTPAPGDYNGDGYPERAVISHEDGTIHVDGPQTEFAAIKFGGAAACTFLRACTPSGGITFGGSAGASKVIPLDGSIVGSATVTAPLSTQKPLLAAVSATGTVTAPLTTSIVLIGAMTGTGAVAAGMTTAIRFAAMLTGMGVVSADLTAAGAVVESDFVTTYRRRRR